MYFVLAWIWIFLWSIYSSINNNYILNNYTQINNYFENKYDIKAEIKELYSVWENTNTYLVSLKNIDKKEFSWIDFLLKLPPNFTFKKWDILSLNWKISKVENFNDTFNYEKFLLSKWVYFIVSFPQIIYYEKWNLNFLDKSILYIRALLLDKIYYLYPKNESAFLAWILIWEKNNFPKELSLAYNNSGLTHLIAVSWFNITIIIIFIWFLLKPFPIILRTFIITFFVVFFTLIVWYGISVVRAAIMWLVWYYILSLWRRGEPLSIFLLTCVILVLFNPLSISYDTSFHLSFLAVLGLLYTSDFWWKIFGFLPKFFAIRDSFVLTMSAFTTTLPIMLFSFWKVALISPISNMLVGWVIPFAMFFWFLSIIWAYINNYLWYLIWYIEYFLLKYVNTVAIYFWNIKNWTFSYDFWILWIYFQILYFMILVFLILYFSKWKSLEIKK